MISIRSEAKNAITSVPRFQKQRQIIGNLHCSLKVYMYINAVLSIYLPSLLKP